MSKKVEKCRTLIPIHISVFIYLHLRTIYMDWYPRSWPMSQSFCTRPDPSLQSENSCQGNGGLNLDRRFYVHHAAEHIRTECFMAVCPKIKEYFKNVFRGICKWMAAYERANIEVLIHVLHQSCTFSATLTVPLQKRSSKWPPWRRMHCSARALKLTLARLRNAHVARMTPMKFAMAFYSCEMYWGLSL